MRWAGSRSAWLALATLVLASAALRAWGSRGIPTPWIAPDELVYGLLGQALWREGALGILGEPTAYYTLVFPALAGLPLALDDLERGYSLLKAQQAFVMSLAAVPVFWWARSLVGSDWALAAAAATVAVPGLAYSGLVMTEVVFYPLLAVTAWTMARAVAEPTAARQLVLLAAIGAAVATRLQAVVLVPAFVTAVMLEAAIARRRPLLRPLSPTLGVLATASVAWVVGRTVAGESVLAGYAGAGGHYELGPALRFVGYHAADLALVTVVFPLCAFLVLLGRALVRGEDDAQVRAFVAVAAATIGWVVVQVGVFASRELGLLAERNLFTLAPLLFVAFAVWLARGGPGGTAARAAAAAAVAVGLLALPLSDLVTPGGLPHAFSLIALHEAGHVGWIQGGLVASVALFAFLPRRALPVLPALVLVGLAAGSVQATRFVADEARTQQEQVVGPERRWVDAHATGPVAYVYDGQAYWPAVWQTLFWNHSIRWVYDLPDAVVPGPLTLQQPLEVRPDGELRPAGKRASARFAIGPVGHTFRGEPIASSPQVGTDRPGLELWRIDPPLRLSTIASGLFENGDVDREAALTAWDCEGGAFEAVLLVKEPQTVVVRLDGRLVEREVFATPHTWRLRIPVPPGTGPGPCKLRIVPSGLLGSTRLAFVRSS